jgi:DNA-binding CsgD family transcriptional regulator
MGKRIEMENVMIDGEGNKVEISRRDGLYGFEMLSPDMRRVDPENRKTYSAKQMWQRTHEIVNLAAKGWNNEEIALMLNITPQTVSNHLNSELGKAKLSEVRYGRDIEAKRTIEKIRILTEKALNTLDDILDSEDEMVPIVERGKFASNFINNISGLRAPIKIHSHNVHTALTAEEIEQMKDRGKNAMREAGLLSD